jgi:hypothetical protein
VGRTEAGPVDPRRVQKSTMRRLVWRIWLLQASRAARASRCARELKISSIDRHTQGRPLAMLLAPYFINDLVHVNDQAVVSRLHQCRMEIPAATFNAATVFAFSLRRIKSRMRSGSAVVA